ncbi:MAG: agmatine deiminase family protein [Pirellulaceae bacterium]|nr:agmatine deiminase family protein [Pirellulaceae bacterium]
MPDHRLPPPGMFPQPGRVPGLLPPPGVPGLPLLPPALADGKNCRLPGEFERQGALLLGSRELLTQMPDVFSDIVEATQNHVEIIALVNDQDEAELVRRVLQRREIAAPVHLVAVSHNTMWARDYGPLAVELDGRALIIDSAYGQLARPQDDHVPHALAGQWRLPLIQTPLILEGGNLLSNGQGLCVATRKLVDDNLLLMNELLIEQWLARIFGATTTVFLEPLAGEATGHVDMFAAFAAPDVVVVGAYDPLVDAENAAVLDRNAERLAQVEVRGKPLRVVRVPMPARDDSLWRTYTNVVFANGVLLVPAYPGRDDEGRRQALETYSRLLPGWRIVPVDASPLIACGGALHCITMNLGPLRRVPRSHAMPPAAQPRQRVPAGPSHEFTALTDPGRAG